MKSRNPMPPVGKGKIAKPVPMALRDRSPRSYGTLTKEDSDHQFITESYIRENKLSLFEGDCLKIMPHIADKSIDLILCDLPYGITKNM